MKFVLILLALFLQLGFSQQATTQSASNSDQPTKVTRVVRIRYSIAQKIADLIRPGAFATVVNADNLLNVVMLTGRPSDVASLEQTIHELDVPASAQASKTKDIELIVSVIGGSDKNGLLPEGQTSEAIAPVIKQLRAIFPYKNYQLLSSMLLRSRDGGIAGNSGAMKSLGDDLGDYSQPSRYQVGFEEINISPEQGKSIIYIRKFRFDTKVPIVIGKLKNNDGSYASNQIQNSDVGILTDVHLQEGQKIVVGKANVGNSDLALFVVLTAKLVD